jgi:crotonobetainyl-CoA:carnitine CoA-transferase CaiB-like acyl-CoA transferase
MSAITSSTRESGLWIKKLICCRSAEIIKVEHPTRGDDTRAWGPPFAKYTQGDDARHVGPPFSETAKGEKKRALKGPRESAYFIAVSLLSRVEWTNS